MVKQKNVPSHVAALQEAIEICVTQTELASRIAAFRKRPSFKQRTISYWLTTHALIEAEWWEAFEHATNGVTTREKLRPDVFGRVRAA